MYVAGQIGLCPATMTMLESGSAAQSRLALRHVERILAAMNDRCSLGDILLAVCYVTRRRYIPFAQQEWLAALADRHKVRARVKKRGPCQENGVPNDSNKIYTIILLKSVAVSKLQVAILARSSREKSQTVRID